LDTFDNTNTRSTHIHISIIIIICISDSLTGIFVSFIAIHISIIVISSVFTIFITT
jgi:hypothetical protein